MGAYLRKDDFSGDMEKVFSYFPRLKERKKQTAGTLSGGEQQMLAMGRALMSRPKLMMLEVTNLNVYYDNIRALKDVSFSVEEGRS